MSENICVFAIIKGTYFRTEMKTNLNNTNTKTLLHKALLFLPSDTISHQNKDEEMSSGHFDSEAQRERRTEHFGLLNLLPTKTRIKTSWERW